MVLYAVYHKIHGFLYNKLEIEVLKLILRKTAVWV